LIRRKRVAQSFLRNLEQLLKLRFIEINDFVSQLPELRSETATRRNCNEYKAALVLSYSNRLCEIAISSHKDRRRICTSLS